MRIDNDLSRYSISSMIMGCFGLFVWLVPIVAVLWTPVGFFLGIKGYDSEQRGLSKVGIYFNVLGFILACIRSGWVVWMG